MEFRTWFLMMVSVALPLTAVATNEPAVLDIDGHPLRGGQQYSVLPWVRGRGGGLALKMRNNTCPMYVVQERFEISPGFPVIFTPACGKKGIVEVGEDVKVEMAAATICVQSTTWAIQADAETGKFFVVAGGDGTSLFKIEKEGDVYAFVYCPVVCDTCRSICGPLGIYNDEDFNRWLTVGSPSFRVQFKKVEK